MSNRPAAPTPRRRKLDGINNINKFTTRPLLDGSGNGITTGMSSGQINSFSHAGGAAVSNSFPSSGSHYSPSNAAVDDDEDSNLARHSPLWRSILQPRLAVFLGVPRRWHPFLFICRLWSIVPAIYWGFPSIVRLLALVHLKYIVRFGFGGGITGGAGGGGIGTNNGGNEQIASSMATAASSALHGAPASAATYDWSSSDVKLRFTEAWITVLWVTIPTELPRSCYMNGTDTESLKCCASGWVSFFLTDSLMSRA